MYKKNFFKGVEKCAKIKALKNIFYVSFLNVTAQKILKVKKMDKSKAFLQI